MVVTHIGRLKLEAPISIDCECRQGWLCDKCYRENLAFLYGRPFSAEEAKVIREDPRRRVY